MDIARWMVAALIAVRMRNIWGQCSWRRSHTLIKRVDLLRVAHICLLVQKLIFYLICEGMLRTLDTADGKLARLMVLVGA